MQDEKIEKFSVEMAPEKNTSQAKRFWHINKEMLPYKLHFFLYVGGMGAILPYQSVFAVTRLGLTASNLAAAYTTQQFLFILFKPGIGYLADYFNKLKATIVGLTITMVICSFLMVMIPSIDVQRILNDHEYQSIGERNKCYLCNNYQEFRIISFNLPFDETAFKEGSNCLQKSLSDIEYLEVYCDNQNKRDYIKIVYWICNSTNLYEFSASNQSSLHERVLIFMNLSLNVTETLHAICVFPSHKESSLIKYNITFSLLKKYCYSVPQTKHSTIESLMPLKSVTRKNISCDNDKSRNTLHVMGTHNEALSSAIFESYQFWLFSLCLISTCTCTSSIFTISDTACYESVQRTGSEYGKQRVWGAISWGISSPLAGFLIDYTDSYIASWGLMAVLCSLQICNLYRMDLVKPNLSQSILKNMKSVFCSIDFIAFEIGVFMSGLFTGIVWFYLTWFITIIGGNGSVIGLAYTFQCFFGLVPFFFFSSWMIKKLGHFNIVSLGLFTFGVRFLIYSYLYNPWWILPVECLHGLTFGLFYPAMTSYAKLSSKPGTEATTQAILCVTFEALGAGTGCILAGICFDRLGPHTTFFYAAFVCAMATAINVLFTLLIGYKKRALKRCKTDDTQH